MQTGQEACESTTCISLCPIRLPVKEGSSAEQDATRQIVWSPAGHAPGSHLPAAQCGKGCGRCKSAKVGKRIYLVVGPDMDRPKPGVCCPLPSDCAESPASTSPVGSLHARLISSSHPHALVASCLPRCRSAARLIRAPSLPPHRTVRGTLRRLSQYLSYVFA